jgi:hydrogenase-4 component E
MLAGKIVRNNIMLLTIQSLSLSIIAFYLGLSGEEINWHMAVVGGLTLTVKGIVLPWVLYRLVKKDAVSRVVLLSIGLVPSILIGVLLVGLTYSYVVPVLLKEIQVGSQLLSAALSTVLLGCFFMISRRSALSQLIGVIVMENGLYLCGVAVTGGMPLIIELGIFFDLLVGVLVMGIMTDQIREAFDTLDTKLLNKLKG